METDLVRYWRSLDEQRIQCLLCSHACILLNGERGHCNARENRAGSMVLPWYAWISSIAIDPVEKKPLRRFMPNTWTYSVGFWHCTMDCPFCQNWEIAHPVRIEKDIIGPERLIELAVESGCPSISFTYSEPTLHIEYVVEAMQLAHRRGLKTILVTNGNALPGPARDILLHTDATNVDLKTADPVIYKDSLGGEIKVVQKFIQIAAELCHLEVTSLAVPGVLDSLDQIEEISRFLASVSTDIPLHITRYHPAWKFSKAPLPLELVHKMGEAAKQHLKYVYSYG
jgi:pyruvate formate lyase activating enzyme